MDLKPMTRLLYVTIILALHTDEWYKLHVEGNHRSNQGNVVLLSDGMEGIVHVQLGLGLPTKAPDRYRLLWHTICADTNWNEHTANVICRTLRSTGTNFTGRNIPLTEYQIYDKKNNGYLRIRYDKGVKLVYQCQQNETTIFSCTKLERSCPENTPRAAVICNLTEECKTEEMRLVDGNSGSSGVVQYCSPTKTFGRWTNIQLQGSCINKTHYRLDQSQNKIMANHVCKRIFPGQKLVGVVIPSRDFAATETKRSNLISRMTCLSTDNCIGTLERQDNNQGFNITCGQNQTNELLGVACKPEGSLGLDCNRTMVRLRANNRTTEKHYGKVEICSPETTHGVWARPCMSSWDDAESRVLCRQLGYGEKSNIQPRDDELFPRTGGFAVKLPKKCFGYETNIFNCNGLETRVDNCTSAKDIDIICDTADGCDKTGNIRLADGKVNGSGRVEVCSEETDYVWGTVCDDGWDINDARVACRMLGFSDAHNATTSAWHGRGVGFTSMDNVMCDSTENSLFDCKHHTWQRENCGHNEDAGVFCKNSPVLRNNITNVTAVRATAHNITIQWLPSFKKECNRTLVTCAGISGSKTFWRRVHTLCRNSRTVCRWLRAAVRYEIKVEEFKKDGTVLSASSNVTKYTNPEPPSRVTAVWNTTFVDLQWAEPSAHIKDRADLKYFVNVTHQTRHIHTEVTNKTSYRISGIPDAVMYRIEISSRIGFATSDPITITGRTKIDTSKIRVRLIEKDGSDGYYQGRVEVNFSNNSFMTVCDDLWDKADAKVICRMLGFPGVLTAKTSQFGPGTLPIGMDNTNCRGNESSIFHCNYNTDHNCGHAEDVGVICEQENGVPNTLVVKASIEDEKIKFLWNPKPMDFNGQFRYYTVKIYESSDNKSTNLKLVKVEIIMKQNITNFNVTNFKPFICYGAQVMITNQGGISGNYSNLEHIVTPPGKPPKPQILFNKITPITENDSMTIFWHIDRPYGLRSRYRIQYCEQKIILCHTQGCKQQKETVYESNKFNMTQHLTLKLAYYTEYCWRVKRENDKSAGEYTTWYAAKTGFGKPVKPENMECESRNDTLTVSWKNPAAKRGPTKQAITVFKIGSSQTIVWQDKQYYAKNAVVIKQLEPMQKYRVDIMSVSEAGNSENATKICATLEGVPGRPEFIHAKALSYNSTTRTSLLSLEWSHPSVPNLKAKIMGYKICIEALGIGKSENKCPFSEWENKFQQNPISKEKYQKSRNLLNITLQQNQNYKIRVASVSTQNAASKWAELMVFLHKTEEAATERVPEAKKHDLIESQRPSDGLMIALSISLGISLFIIAVMLCYIFRDKLKCHSTMRPGRYKQQRLVENDAFDAED